MKDFMLTWGMAIGGVVMTLVAFARAYQAGVITPALAFFVVLMLFLAWVCWDAKRHV